MRKRMYWFGMTVGLLMSVLPVAAEPGTYKVNQTVVSMNGTIGNGEEGRKIETAGYMSKEAYWDFGKQVEELEQSGKSTLPASYDSRNYGYVTAPKNQGDYGTCWAFATIAAVESSLLKHGLADATVDLSEYHLTYFSYSENLDPLGNTEGDYYVPHFTLEGKLRVGGTVQDAMEQLAKWGGPVDESRVPYSAALNLEEPSSALAYEAKYHLKNAYYADCSNQDAIKALVYEHGGASGAYYADHNYMGQRNGEGTYYVPNVTVANHAVCIVGWKDDFPKEAFVHTPPGDGAWLCKDSDQLNPSYVWVSYYTSISDVVAVELEETERLDHNYQFDGCVSGTSSYKDVLGSNSKVTSFLNVFEAKVSQEYLEELEAVSIHVNGNESYSICVYVNPVINNQGKITDYEYKSAPLTYTSGMYAGIRMVELKESIYLNAGDRFGVEVKGERMETYAVSSSPNHGYEAMKSGECFVGVEEQGGMIYKDLSKGAYPVTPRIKAFTKSTTIPCATGLFLDQEQMTLKAGESYRLKASVLVPSGGLSGVTFSSTNPAIASVAANGEISAHKAGVCEIIAQCTYGEGKKVCKVQVENVLASSLETENYVNLTEGESYILTSILDGKATSRKLEYISENPQVAKVDAKGQIDAVSPGETKIHVKTTDGSQLTAICLVKVTTKKKRVENLYLSMSETVLLVGQSAKLVVSWYPEDATDAQIIYLVSNPTVVSVQGDVVKALAPGSASITAKVAGGEVMASVQVQVYETGSGSKESQKQEPQKETKKVQIGDSFTSKSLKYQVTGKEKVQVVGATKKTVKSIVIPNFVKYKGTVYLVTSVSDKAFCNYKKLKTVKMGGNIKKIGVKAFSGCKKLKTVTISSTVLTTVGKNAFSKTSEKLILKVPKKKLTSYKKRFKKAGLSKKVTWKKKS